MNFKRRGKLHVMPEFSHKDREEIPQADTVEASTLSQEAEYRPVAERMKNSKEVMAFAKEFSERYEVPLEIQNEKSCIIFRLCCHEMLYTKYMKREIAGLILLCDEMSIMTKGVGDWDYTIELTYYTHDVYINGKKMRIAR